MKKDFIIDYLGYILIKLAGPLLRSLPLSVSLFLGRRLGQFCYYFDTKHKAIAYANIKTVFAGKLSPSQISHITKEFYRSFGQNVVEVLLIPLVDKAYINKYITLQGEQYIYEGFKNGKGVILLGLHEGSWELSNIICANLGFPFSLFIRPQRYPRLNKLLNSYRSQRGCRIIQKENQMRKLLQILNNNEAIGMSADQGGKTGMRVKFFGKSASMATGAVRLALKYDVALIPAFYTRINGPQIKVFIEPPFEIKKTGDLERDIHDNLQEVVHIFEKYILRYPQEYFWSYKIWKYSQEKTILILSDRKTGHLRQSQAIAQILGGYLQDMGISTNVNMVEIKFKNGVPPGLKPGDPCGTESRPTFIRGLKVAVLWRRDKFSRAALIFSSCLAGKYRCQGCLFCLKAFLAEDTYKTLVSIKPDMVISCGSSLAPINYIIARENLAKSIVVMRPSILSTRRFDLVVMSQHDSPPKRKNVAVIEGALNLINADYLKEQGTALKTQMQINKELVIGLLVGGDTRVFHLNKDLIKEIIKQMKMCLEKLDGELLVTTSRRTHPEIERLLKEEFSDYPRCKLLIIANEKNIPGAVPGILRLSKIIITSPESISMISEAASSGRYVIVFDPKTSISHRHSRFLTHFAKKKYIYLVDSSQISKTLEEIITHRPEIVKLKDSLQVKEAMGRLL